MRYPALQPDLSLKTYRELDIYQGLYRLSATQAIMRELLKQYLTEKQNGCLRSGHLWEVVAYEKWSL